MFCIKYSGHAAKIAFFLGAIAFVTDSIESSVADPDPLDPHVPNQDPDPDHHHAKIVRKTLIPTYYFVTLYSF